MLKQKIEEAGALPAAFRGQLDRLRQRTLAFARETARAADRERHARLAATALYNITTAVLLAWEGTRPGFDARRAVLSRFVVEHRLETADPLMPRDDSWEDEATTQLLDDAPIDLATACRLVAA
jgi:hypothetical protein